MAGVICLAGEGGRRATAAGAWGEEGGESLADTMLVEIFMMFDSRVSRGVGSLAWTDSLPGLDGQGSIDLAAQRVCGWL